VRTAGAIRVAGAIRAGLGLLEVLAPGRAGRIMGVRLDPPTRRVVRVLGARQLLQAIMSASEPTPAVLALGAEVDALHSASMAAVALASRRLRRAALAECLAAALFAASGVRGASRAATRWRGGTRSGPIGALAGRRDRWAAGAARWLVPRYQPVAAMTGAFKCWPAMEPSFGASP
jgi:hypothetical protein